MVAVQVEVSQPKGGAGQSIIGTLEVYKRDFFEDLAKEETEESDAASECDKTTQAKRLQRQQWIRMLIIQDQELKTFDKETTELTGDKDTANTAFRSPGHLQAAQEAEKIPTTSN